MTTQELLALKPGQLYHVRMKNTRRVRRIFKWTEYRHQDILCAVFTSQVRGSIAVRLLGPAHMQFTGRSVPRSEWSVPHYDLTECTEITHDE